MHRIAQLLIVVAALSSAAPQTAAQTAKVQTGKTPAAVSAADRAFVQQASMIHLAEIKIGQLAHTKGNTDWVRNFGTRIVQDHSTANQELIKLAANLAEQMPTGLDAKHRAVFNRLNRLNGSRFDAAFRAEMAKGHRHAIALFTNASESADDPRLRAYAAKHLPMLQDHLAQLQNPPK